MRARVVDRLLSGRIYLLAVVHLAIFVLSFDLAYRLRFDFLVPADERATFWSMLPWILAIKIAIFHSFGSLHGWWRYVSFADLAELLRVATLSMLAIASVDYFVLLEMRIPRSVLLLDWGVTLLFVGGGRSVSRMVREHVWPTLANGDRRPALMIGANRGGEGLAQQINNHPKLNYRVVGFLDTNASYHGLRIGGIPVVGRPDDVVALADRYDAEDVLLIADSIAAGRVRELMTECREANISLKVVPTVDELMNGAHRLQIRDLDIDDLLRRPPVQLDSASIRRMIVGQCVLITGGGGSIGSELCRQVLACKPSQLIVVERAENSLFNIMQALGESTGDTQLFPYLVDLRDAQRMDRIFETHRPQAVFHAAAHKHVPIAEANPGETLHNNILSTKTLADLAHSYRVDRFVLISTDKAVNPTSCMGASKRLAERYILALSDLSMTKFVAVRFGNVLASSGSVVPIFQEQIRRGGPITITHPEMTRYFMTIKEASQLVLQAGAIGKGGEVFVLDMGEPVKILDLAKDLIRISGLTADDIEIKIVGMRPGEKLREELNSQDEDLLPSSHPRIRVTKNGHHAYSEVNSSIDCLTSYLHHSNDVVRQKLAEVLPEYRAPQTLSQLEQYASEPAGRAT